jgi:hypothetical protein
MDDLQFRLQQLDGKASALLHILSTFQGVEEKEENVPAETFGRSKQELLAEGVDLGQAMHVDREVAVVVDNADANAQMEWRGTPVEEELWDEATHAT